MAVNINNNYRNQYKVIKGMKASFDAYWSKSGIKDDSIRLVMQAIFNLLDDDIRHTVNDNDYNQTILDRIEFQNLFQVITGVLNKYLDVSSDDTVYTTDATKHKIIDSILKELNLWYKSILDENTEFDSQDFSNTKDELKKILDEFFENIDSKKSKTKKTGNVNGDGVHNIFDIFYEKLQDDNQKGKEIDYHKSFEQSDIYKKFQTKLYKNTIKFKNNVISLFSQNNQQKDINKGNFLKRIIKNGIFNDKNNENNKKRSNKVIKFNTLLRYYKRKITKTIKKREKNILNFAEANFKSLLLAIPKAIMNVVTNSLGFAYTLFMGTVSFAISTVKFLFKPLFKFFGGIWNTIRHPLSSLNKILSSNWLLNVFKITFSNPAVAYSMGFFVGVMWNFVKRTVIGFVKKWIIIPSLTFVKFITDWLNPNKHNTFANILLDIIEITKDLFDNVLKILTPAEGANSMVASIIVNIANMAGLPIGVSIANLLTNQNVLKLYKQYRDMKHSFLGNVASGTNNIYVKLAAWAGSAAANFVGQSYNVDEETKALTLKEELNESLKKSKTRMDALKSMNEYEFQNQKKFMDDENAKKQFESQKASIDHHIGMLNDEVSKLNALNNFLEDLFELNSNETLDDEILEFFLSGGSDEETLFDTKQLREIVLKLCKKEGGNSFVELDREKQLAVLNTLLKMRTSKVNDLYALYQNQSVEDMIKNDELMKRPVVLTITQLDEKTVGGNDSLSLSTTLKTHHEGGFQASSFPLTPVFYVPEHDSTQNISIKFGNSKEQNETMRLLSQGIDAESDLARYIRRQIGPNARNSKYKGKWGEIGQKGTQMLGTGILKIDANSSLARELVADYFQENANEQNLQTSTERLERMVATAVTTTWQSGGDMMEGVKFNQSGVDNATAKIMGGQKKLKLDSVESLETIVQNIKNSENISKQYQDELLDYIQDAFHYNIETNTIVVDGNVPLVSDTKGEK